MLFAVVMLVVMSAPSYSGQAPTCEELRSSNSISEEFPRIASHLIHSMTLQDLRTHFNRKTPLNNGIPTINPNLTGAPRILSSVPDLPLDNSFNVFKHPGLDALDSVLSHMDDPDWGWRNAPILEHIVHEYHVLATVTEVAKVYKRIVKKWKKKKFARANLLCECLRNEDSMIIRWLEGIDTIMQGPLDGTVTRMQMIAHRYAVSEYALTMNRDGILVHRNETQLPVLEDEASWDEWKHEMEHHLTEDGVSNNIWLKNAGIYLFCKLKDAGVMTRAYP